MKSLVVYSSRTGNTEKICRAAAEVLPGATVLPVAEAPQNPECDLLVVGYWVDKGMPDAAAKKYLENVSRCRVALLGTLGAWPDSEHAQDCRNKGEALLEGRDNTVLGTFLCQGKVDPRVVEMMQKMGNSVHPMTEERKARLAEAAKHPDDRDCEQAQAFLRKALAALPEGQPNL